MNRKKIWGIIILMTLALLGIAVTQFIWIKAQVDLDESNFDSRVVSALSNVKMLLQEDAEYNQDFAREYFSKNNGSSRFSPEASKKIMGLLSSDKKNHLSMSADVAGILSIMDPKSTLENIDKDDLDKYLKQELENQKIKIKYDYGIYSNEEQDFTIYNGNYFVQVSGNSSQANADPKQGLYDTNYQIQLFNDENQSPGELKLFFPGKQSYLWSSVWKSMLTSLLFTSLILFCFSYTIFIIFKQKKVSEMKTDFINNMTHEFKTPIATISLAADSINNPNIISNQNKVSKFIGIIKQENKRMLNQVEKVLQMARIDKKDFELKITDVNLNDVINQAVENTKLKIKSRNGVITTNLKATNAYIKGDLTHISNIINNLLDNAEKYSSGSPEINISSKELKTGVEVAISDKGIGMTKEAIKNIFDKFYRVHTGNRHDVKGFGLGLSYVKALVTAHKGTVNVESELDKGSTFTVFFPFTLSD